MDAVALASVISSGVVAVATVGANVWLRRGDRQHERRLDYARRVWADKSSALALVMARCNALQAACVAVRRDITTGAPIATTLQRMVVLQAMTQVRFSGDDAKLIAYADRRVRDLVKRLDGIVSRELSPLGDLVDLERALAENRQPRAGSVTVEELAATTDLDIAELERLCAEIIDAARKDLRSG